MTKYSVNDKRDDLYNLKKRCERLGINFSELLVSIVSERIEEVGVSKLINRLGNERVDGKKVEKDAKGKIKRVQKVDLPREIVDMHDTAKAINRKNNRVRMKVRVEDKPTDNIQGYDLYVKLHEIKVVGDNVEFVHREGLSTKVRELKNARLTVTDPFGMPVSRTGVERSVEYFKSNPIKLLRTFKNMEDITNLTKDGWMSKYSLLKTDVVIKEGKNEHFINTAKFFQVLLYFRYENIINRLVKNKRFNKKRAAELKLRAESMKEKLSKAHPRSLDGNKHDLIVELVLKNKKERG